MVDVTAVMKAIHIGRPDIVDWLVKIAPAWSPARCTAQAIVARAVMGTTIFLARNSGRSREGWIKMNGSWKTQKRKKFRKEYDVNPEPLDKWLCAKQKSVTGLSHAKAYQRTLEKWHRTARLQ